MPSSQSGVAVVGSANMDVVFVVARVPRPGETLLADRAALYPGGKGLNQAVAAARAGAATTFIGAVGRDDHGAALTRVLDDDGLDRRQLRRSDESTGQAFIVVDPAGVAHSHTGGCAVPGEDHVAPPVHRGKVRQCAVGGRDDSRIEPQLLPDVGRPGIAEAFEGHHVHAAWPQ